MCDRFDFDSAPLMLRDAHVSAAELLETVATESCEQEGREGREEAKGNVFSPTFPDFLFNADALSRLACIFGYNERNTRMSERPRSSANPQAVGNYMSEVRLRMIFARKRASYGEFG